MYPSNAYEQAQSSLDGPNPVPVGYPGADKLEWLLHRFDALPIHQAVASMEEVKVRQAVAHLQTAQENAKLPVAGLDDRKGAPVTLYTAACPITGETALHVAAACGQPTILRLLLSSGLYSADEEDMAGLTPLMYLSWLTSEPFHTGRIRGEDITECVDLLLSNGADVRKTIELSATWKLQCWPKATALDWAARSCNVPFLEALVAYSKTRRALNLSVRTRVTPYHLEVDCNLLPSTLQNEHWLQKFKLMQVLRRERYYVLMDQRGWENSLKEGNLYDSGSDIEEKYSSLRAEAEKTKPPRVTGVGRYGRKDMDCIKQSQCIFGPRGEHGQQPTPAQPPTSFYAWDFSSSRLTLSGSGGASFSNSALACTDTYLRRWKQTVRVLCDCGIAVDLRGAVIDPHAEKLPTQAALYLLDLFVEQDPVSGVTWPTAYNVPPKVKLDHPSLLQTRLLYSPIGFGTVFTLTLVVYMHDSRPLTDIQQLIEGLLTRGLDLGEQVHQTIIPYYPSGRHLQYLAPFLDINKQVTPFETVIQSVTTVRQAWETTSFEEAYKIQAKWMHEPVSLFGYCIYTKKTKVAEALLGAGMKARRHIVDGTLVEWNSYLPKDASEEELLQLRALVDKLSSSYNGV